MLEYAVKRTEKLAMIVSKTSEASQALTSDLLGG